MASKPLTDLASKELAAEKADAVKGGAKAPKGTGKQTGNSLTAGRRLNRRAV